MYKNPHLQSQGGGDPGIDVCREQATGPGQLNLPMNTAIPAIHPMGETKPIAHCPCRAADRSLHWPDSIRQTSSNRPIKHKKRTQKTCLPPPSLPPPLLTVQLKSTLGCGLGSPARCLLRTRLGRSESAARRDFSYYDYLLFFHIFFYLRWIPDICIIFGCSNTKANMCLRLWGERTGPTCRRPV